MPETLDIKMETSQESVDQSTGNQKINNFEDLNSKVDDNLNQIDKGSIQDKFSYKEKDNKVYLFFESEQVGYVENKSKFESLLKEIFDKDVRLTLQQTQQEAEDLRREVLTYEGMSLGALFNLLDNETGEVYEKAKDATAEKLIEDPSKISEAIKEAKDIGISSPKEFVKNKIIHNHFLDNEGFMENYQSYYSKFNSYEKHIEGGSGLSQEEIEEVKESGTIAIAYKKALIDFYPSINEVKFNDIFLNNFYDTTSDVGEDLKEYSNFVEKVESLKGSNFSETVKQRGVVGALHDMIDSSKMGKKHSDIAKGLADMAPVLGGIYAAYRAISEYGFMKTIGGLVAGEFGLAATTGHGLFDWVKRFSYGGAGAAFSDMRGDSTEALIEAGEDSKEKKEKVGPIAFLGMVLGDSMKVDDLKGYLKYESGNIKSFKLDEYYRSLPQGSQKKSFINELRSNHDDETISSLIIQGLKELGFNYYKDRDSLTIGAIIESYRQQMQQGSGGGQEGGGTNGNESGGAGGGDQQGGGGESSTQPPPPSGGSGDEDGGERESGPGDGNDDGSGDDGNDDGSQGNGDGSGSSQHETGVESISLFERVGYVEDGQYYMIGSDGEPQKFEYSQLSPEAKEKLEEYQKENNFIDDVMFLVNAYEKLNSDSSLSADIQQEVQNWYLNPDENIKSNIQDIITNSQFFRDYGERNNLLHPDESDKNDIFHLEGEERRTAIYKFIRNDLEESQMVSSEIAKEKFEEISNFSNDDISLLWDKFSSEPKSSILSKINTKEDGIYRKINNYFGQNISEIRDFLDHIYEKYEEAEQQLVDNHETIKERVDNLISEREDLYEEDREEMIEKIKDVYKASIFDLAFKKYILNYHIQNNDISDGGTLSLYKDIEGIGTFDVADSTLDIGEEVFTLVLTEAIAIGAGIFTAGVGFAAVNAAVWGTRGIRGAKWAYNLTQKSSRAARVARGAGRSVVEGVGFYQGMNYVRNAIENWEFFAWENFEGAGDLSENMKSIAMMGAFRALGQLTNKIPGLAVEGGEKTLPKTLKIGGQVSIEGIALGAGLGSYDVMVEGGEWDRDMLIEGLLMAAAFRMMNGGVNRLNLRMRDNKPEIYTNSRGQEIQYRYDKKTGEIKSAVYKKTGEPVNHRQLAALKRKRQGEMTNRETRESQNGVISLDYLKQLSPKQLAEKIKNGSINVKNLSKDKTKAFFDKLTGRSDWSINLFKNDLRELAAKDKTEFGKKLAKTVLFGKPNASWKNSSLGQKVGSATFAGLTWFPQFYKGSTEGFDEVNFEELVQDYAAYGVLNRFIGAIYFLDEMEQVDFPYTEVLREFTSNADIPSEWFDKAAELPLSYDLAHTLKKWGSQSDNSNSVIDTQ